MAQPIDTPFRRSSEQGRPEVDGSPRAGPSPVSAGPCVPSSRPSRDSGRVSVLSVGNRKKWTPSIFARRIALSAPTTVTDPLRSGSCAIFNSRSMATARSSGDSKPQNWSLALARKTSLRTARSSQILQGLSEHRLCRDHRLLACEDSSFQRFEIRLRLADKDSCRPGLLDRTFGRADFLIAIIDSTPRNHGHVLRAPRRQNRSRNAPHGGGSCAGRGSPPQAVAGRINRR